MYFSSGQLGFTVRLTCLYVSLKRMRGSFLRRQRGPLRRAKSMENVHSNTSYQAGPSFLATVELITLSEAFSIPSVTCHHMPATNCNCRIPASGCLCSSVVGQKQETASSSSFITVFKFSFPAVETRLRNLGAFTWKSHTDVYHYWMTISF